MAKKVKLNTKSYKYGTLRVRTQDGKLIHSVGNADAVAKAMLLHTAKGGKLGEIVKANDLGLKQGDRNNGLFRMSVGIALRAKVAAGESVKIGSVRVTSLRQKVELPKVEAIARKANGKSKPKAKRAKKAKKAKKAKAPRRARQTSTPAAAAAADASQPAATA